MVAPILTLTPNPALDIAVSTPRLMPGRKLRCTAPRYDAGGGGANVSRVIHELDGRSTALVAAGGPTGARYIDALRAEGVEVVAVAADGDTRFSFTVAVEATGEHYRFVLPGPQQSITRERDLLTAVTDSIGDGARIVVGSGSLPPGLAIDFYGKVGAAAKDAGARLILDTSGPALKAALAHDFYCVRINHHEAGELVGVGSLTVDAARRFTRELVDAKKVEVAIVTVGEAGVVVASRDGSFAVHPPPVEVTSMVGAGDSFVGALALGLSRDWPLELAARFGVAAAAATVTTEATELCHRADVERYFAQLQQQPSD